MILRMGVIVVAGVIACSGASTAEPTMSIHFVGDWCYEQVEDKTTTYTLPSWTEDGQCTKSKILSIAEDVFYGEGRHCDPVKIRYSQKTAPSGTAYTALVTASCEADGPVTGGKLQTFEFYRYKGHLTVTTK